MCEVATIRHISKCTIKPHHTSEESQQPCYLTPWDLSLLTTDYYQKGLLFKKPQHLSVENIIDQLKDSLSCTLTQFFPLCGRLVTKKNADPHSYCVFVDCENGLGAELVYVFAADQKISDILSPIDVPPIVESLFPLDRAINHDGHNLPLLAVQVTELVDGIFIGCSFNHAVADGGSFWRFMSAWTEISRKTEENIEHIPRCPVTKRWFLNSQDQIINLPYSHHDEFIVRYVPTPLRERMFHFSSQSIAQIKEKANADVSTNKISSFQALAAFVWRSVTRARCFAANQKTTCWITVDNRLRLDPPLSKDYFGNCISAIYSTTTAGEILSNSLGWSALILNKEIAAYTSEKACATIEALTKVPYIYQYGVLNDSGSVSFGSSPRFDVYGNDFGWGAPIAVRSGYGNKYDGMMEMFPGREGGGSVDLEVCLIPESMAALEMDGEFMTAVSSASA
ncbi:hypothetical protein FRX31_007537 [Thalictrum thalictroides]|uniref:HXXXD-type acyl-transferase family protein n=1 Tax=Thalictrum thalictroides TaxID=46969 RepID=A0A7J6X1Y3_THATH|nr:hypothetical protein FRX31_007537 [Thalictrum thalictroides]